MAYLLTLILFPAMAERPAYAQSQVRNLNQRPQPIPPRKMALSPEPLPGYVTIYVSVYGSDSNDGTGWGSAKRTIAGALLACSSYKVDCHITIAPGTYTFSSTLQLPINSQMASCVIEGSSSAGAQGTGSGLLFDQGITLLEYTGAGVAIDQTFTNSNYQNALGCSIRDLDIDGAKAGSGATGIRFGGTVGFRLSRVQVSNFSGPGDVGVEVYNAESGLFTEQWNFELLRISNDATGVEFTGGPDASPDFGHGFGNFIWNEFSNQTGISLSRGDIYDSVLINNGNFAGNSCNGVVAHEGSSAGDGNTWIYWGAENDGNCTRFTAADGSILDFSGMATGSGHWKDSGKVIVEGNNSGLWGFPNLSIGSGSMMKSTGAGGTMASMGPNGISAGTLTLFEGSASHTFAFPYSEAPVCTASDMSSTTAVRVKATATAVYIQGNGSDVVSWSCSPAVN